MNSPSAPDPMMSSMIQAQLYKDAAREQQKMNMVSQTTPYGSLDYESDPSSPSQYRARQQVSPEIKKVLDANIGLSGDVTDVSRNLVSNARDRMATPLDLSYDTNAMRISDLQRKTLDPMWQQRQNQFDQTMADRGLVPGSQAYTNAARDFGMMRDNAYNNMFLSSWDKANQNAITEYQMPFNSLASLKGGTQITNAPELGLTQTPQETIQAPDYMGMEQSNYSTKASMHNAMLGGLFGLGGKAMGMLGG